MSEGPAAAPAEAGRFLRRRGVRAATLILAWLATLTLFPYAYGRTLILGVWIRQLDWGAVALLLVSLALLAGLSWQLGRVYAPAPRRKIGLWIAMSWLAVNGGMIAFFAGGPIARIWVVVLFVGSSLWVCWSAWLFWWPVNARIRWIVLAALLFCAPAFPLLMDVEGVNGAADEIEFKWRLRAVKPAELEPVASGRPIEVALAGPQDFSQFLGPLRLGVLPDARLEHDWSRRPVRRLWQRRVGAGWSGFAVVGAYAFTQEQRSDQECVVCYQVADGVPVWLHADRLRYDASMGGVGPRATPAVADGRIYTVGATGLLNCLDAATGQAVWSVNILEDNQAENTEHGVCASPLVLADRVLVCPTGRNGLSLSAYDRATGQRLWQAGQDRASYSSPLLTELAGVRQVLLGTTAGVAAHDPATGQLLWRFPWTNQQGINASQPIPHAGQPDQVFFSTGYGKGAVLFRVLHSGQGAWSTELVREFDRQMKTKFTTPVLHDGCIYGLDDGILACVDLSKGKTLWKDGRYGHGQLLLAGDLLIIQTEKGDVVLVQPQPEGLRELYRLPALSGKTWNNPALAGRFLLVRNADEAACFEVPLP
jgi:outer membrane protein assembly factor BamB